MGMRVLAPGVTGWAIMLTTYVHVMLRLRMCGTILHSPR